MSISVFSEVDIVLDENSINTYRKKSRRDPNSSTTHIGSCSADIKFSCDSVLSDLIAWNKDQGQAGIQDLSVEESDSEDVKMSKKCAALGSLKENRMNYYLAYVFDQSPGAIKDIGDSNEINGSLIITPYAPESASGKYGGAKPPVAFMCDPCKDFFKKLQYKDKEELTAIFDKTTQFPKSLWVSYDWTANGFTQDNPPMKYDGKPLSEVVNRTYKDAYGQTKQETIRVPITGKYAVTTNEWGMFGIDAQYDGYNKWLYTKYYGGDQYSIIKKSMTDKKPRVGIDLGKIATVDAIIVKKNLISVSVSVEGGFVLSYVDHETKKPAVSSSIELPCCPTTPEPTYNVFLKTKDKGRLGNKQLSIDVLQRAQGGIYNKDIRVPSQTDPTAPDPCCQQCNYCIFGSLCPGLAGLLEKIRDAEINMREHDASPYETMDKSTGDALYQTARKPGPQCVGFDKYSGWPVPLSDIEGY